MLRSHLQFGLHDRVVALKAASSRTTFKEIICRTKEPARKGGKITKQSAGGAAQRAVFARRLTRNSVGTSRPWLLAPDAACLPRGRSEGAISLVARHGLCTNARARSLLRATAGSGNHNGAVRNHDGAVSASPRRGQVRERSAAAVPYGGLRAPGRAAEAL